MDAMLFAAGLGTRLRPLTHDIPKALAPIAGVPALERVARRVIAAGADRLVINVHHHADQIEDFVASRDGFGVEVRFSRELEAPLETGGGLLQAAPLLRSGPFLIHNTDILTDFPLEPMMEAHATTGALVTLATMSRPASSYLLFDEEGMCGLAMPKGPGRSAGPPEVEPGAEGPGIRWARQAAGPVRALGFCGVHVADERLPQAITERGTFSIIRSYMRLAAEGERLVAHDVDGARWFDIGTLERLREAERALAAD